MTKYILFSVFVLGWVGSGFAENLKAEFATAKLPMPLWGSQLVYDGDNSIYIFGGAGEGLYPDILRYDISSDSIEKVGEMPYPGYEGAAEWNGADGSVFHFGGSTGTEYTYTNVIDSTITTSSSIARLSAEVLDDPMFMISFKQDNSSLTYILLRMVADASLSRVYQFDTSTYEITPVSDSFEFFGLTSFVMDNYAYTLGYKKVLEADMTSLKMEIFDSGPDFSQLSISSAVSDGTNAYLIGGYYSGYMGDFLIQYNPVNHSWITLEVDDFPYTNNIAYYYGPASVFVAKLNRIYYFGGQTSDRETNFMYARES